jgi:hypothetical protein
VELLYTKGPNVEKMVLLDSHLILETGVFGTFRLGVVAQFYVPQQNVE